MKTMKDLIGMLPYLLVRMTLKQYFLDLKEFGFQIIGEMIGGQFPEI